MSKEERGSAVLDSFLEEVEVEGFVDMIKNTLFKYSYIYTVLTKCEQQLLRSFSCGRLDVDQTNDCLIQFTKQNTTDISVAVTSKFVSFIKRYKEVYLTKIKNTYTLWNVFLQTLTKINGTEKTPKLNARKAVQLQSGKWLSKKMIKLIVECQCDSRKHRHSMRECSQPDITEEYLRKCFSLKRRLGCLDHKRTWLETDVCESDGPLVGTNYDSSLMMTVEPNGFDISLTKYQVNSNNSSIFNCDRPHNDNNVSVYVNPFTSIELPKNLQHLVTSAKTKNSFLTRTLITCVLVFRLLEKEDTFLRLFEEMLLEKQKLYKPSSTKIDNEFLEIICGTVCEIDPDPRSNPFFGYVASLFEIKASGVVEALNVHQCQLPSSYGNLSMGCGVTLQKFVVFSIVLLKGFCELLSDGIRYNLSPVNFRKLIDIVHGQRLKDSSKFHPEVIIDEFRKEKRDRENGLVTTERTEKETVSHIQCPMRCFCHIIQREVKNHFKPQVEEAVLKTQNLLFFRLPQLLITQGAKEHVNRTNLISYMTPIKITDNMLLDKNLAHRLRQRVLGDRVRKMFVDDERELDFYLKHIAFLSRIQCVNGQTLAYKMPSDVEQKRKSSYSEKNTIKKKLCTMSPTQRRDNFGEEKNSVDRLALKPEYTLNCHVKCGIRGTKKKTSKLYPSRCLKVKTKTLFDQHINSYTKLFKTSIYDRKTLKRELRQIVNDAKDYVLLVSDLNFTNIDVKNKRNMYVYE